MPEEALCKQANKHPYVWSSKLALLVALRVGTASFQNRTESGTGSGRDPPRKTTQKRAKYPDKQGSVTATFPALLLWEKPRCPERTDRYNLTLRLPLLNKSEIITINWAVHSLPPHSLALHLLKALLYQEARGNSSLFGVKICSFVWSNFMI